MTPAQHEIIADVAGAHGLPVSALLTRSQQRSVVYPRQEAMWRLRNAGRWSYPQIGGLFNRDHTTVIHSCRAYEARLRGERLPRIRQASAA